MTGGAAYPRGSAGESGTSAAPGMSTSRFRADIEGLRAISVLAVLLWHAGIPWLAGGYVGVDVFFVISGFLMTRILVGEAERSGRISLSGFYARRARRLLPAALAALLGTVVLTVLFLPLHRWASIGGDLVASAVYLINWHLAADSVDYLAQESAPSPVQHYWSLAVEEQFYLVWPLLLVIALVVTKRRPARIRGAAWALTGATFVLSLTLSIHLTRTSAAEAYFVTHTRAWELALGAAIALGAGWWAQIPRAMAIAIGWLGLAAIGYAIVTFSAATPFPGSAALVPTMGAAAVLVAGTAAGSRGPVAVLRLRPMQFTGRISYSLYLWHWPFIVVAMEMFGSGHQVAIRYGVLAVALSAIPAWLSWRYVEEPVRRRGSSMRPERRTPESLLLGLNCSLAGVVSGLLLVLSVPPAAPDTDPSWRESPAVAGLRDPFGAMVLGPNPAESAAGTAVDDPGDLLQPLPTVGADRPAYVPEGCNTDLNGVEVGVCHAGDPEGEVLIAVTGDSHAGQWITALDAIGQREGWEIVMMIKSSCPPVTGVDVRRSGQAGPYWQCTEYNTEVERQLVELSPDVVLMSSAQYGVGDEVVADGLLRRVDRLAEADIPSVLIRDTPRPEVNMADCLMANPDQMTVCAFDSDSSRQRSGTGHDLAAQLRPDLPTIDVWNSICPRSMCAPVVGGVVVYRDSNHLSDTYVVSLTDVLAARLVPVVEDLVEVG